MCANWETHTKGPAWMTWWGWGGTGACVSSTDTSIIPLLMTLYFAFFDRKPAQRMLRGSRIFSFHLSSPLLAKMFLLKKGTYTQEAHFQKSFVVHFFNYLNQRPISETLIRNVHICIYMYKCLFFSFIRFRLLSKHYLNSLEIRSLDLQGEGSGRSVLLYPTP